MRGLCRSWSWRRGWWRGRWIVGGGCWGRWIWALIWLMGVVLGLVVVLGRVLGLERWRGWGCCRLGGRSLGLDPSLGIDGSL